MSGAEAIVALGVISSIITIVDGTKQVYDAAANAQGLPEGFREVADRLPIVRNILDSSKRYIEEGDVDEDSCKGVKHVVDACGKKAKSLDKLFHKVIPADGATRVERYFSAVRTLGKGNQVEILMKGMLEDVQLLASNYSMKTITKTQVEQVAKAIAEVSAISPSVPEHLLQDTIFTNNSYGPGPQTNYNAQGDQYNHSGRGKMYNAKTMSFGSDVQIKKPRFYTNTLNVMQGSQGDEAQACLAALFQAIQTDPRDDRENLIQIKGTRVNGTCKWITSNELYKSWLHSNSQLLWLSGGPGKGKTMLSIFLAEELEQIAKHSQDVAFLEYFCDNRDENHNTAIAIIRGLVFQLLRLRPKLFDYILPSFQIQKESLFTASSFETLWRIFETMVHDPVIGTIYCVLDGLDECNEASLEVLLKKFRVLFSPKFSESSACYLNLIVVSRDLPDFIPEVLSSFPRIRLDPDADSEVNSDIHRFIEAKVDELSAYRQYSKPLRLHVKEVFRDRAQGTFLWVGIVATELRKYKATEVEKALDLFPSGLEELYSRMLLQIDIDRRETAAKILRWVVMAVRPLSLSELSAAMEITVRPSFDFSCIEVMRDQVEYCGYILTIKDDKVGLIHQSAKDYLLYKTRNLNPTLEVFRVKEEVGNLEIAKKCLDYLQNGALADGEVDLQRNTLHLQAFPLLSYAVLYWPEHTRSLARSEDIFDLSLPFYRKTSRIRQSWLKTYWAIEEYNDPPDSFTLLCLASYFGILPLAENLLFKKGSVNRAKRLLDLNKKGHLERTALHWAAVRGHEAVVRLLLDKGADIETRDGNGWTALHWAAKWGHEAMVRLLLDKGTDIEARDGSGWTALYGAAIQGHEAVMRLLLEKGADIETRDGSGWTALYVAAILGHEAVVRLLLEKGADIEARDGNGWTALHWAAIRGHEAVVRLLTPRNPNS